MSPPVKSSNQALSCCTDTPETMSPKSTASSPESGVSDELLEFEGTTFFAPTPSPTYRYSMTLKSGKLRIWLEDCESKKQWLTSGLDQRDYVDSTNAIPNATTSDYVEYIHELLEGDYDEEGDEKDCTPITFQRHKGDVFRLQVMVKIQVLKHSRVATYAFDMEPISLERVDVLESKMRDMQEEINGLFEEKSKIVATHDDAHAEVMDILDARDEELSVLKQQVKTLLESHDCAESTQLQATAKVGEWIAWGSLANGVLRVTNPGMYQVTAIVNHRGTSATASIQLFRGSECIQTANCGETDGSYHSTCLACVTRVPKQNYEFAVKCTADLTGTSYLTFLRIGK